MGNLYYGLTFRRLLFWLALLLFFFLGVLLAKSQNVSLENLQYYQENGSQDAVIQDAVSASPLFVQKYAPVLARIRKCESGNRHFGKDGKVIVSKTGDVGLYQINLKTWQKEAERLGIDIWTPEGNEEMAYHILATQGLKAWVCYKKLGG